MHAPSGTSRKNTSLHATVPVLACDHHRSRDESAESDLERPREESATGAAKALARMSPSSATSAPSSASQAVPNVASILDELVDPLNRYYRYPLCNALALRMKNVPITPNQITVVHALVGVGAGLLIARGSKEALIAAFVLAEVRMVLDCLDGSVARTKKIFHPYGRTIDELGDAIGFSAMMAGTYWNVAHGRTNGIPDSSAGALFCGVIAISGIMAWGYDFYKRKFTSALRDNQDGIGHELSKKTALYMSCPHKTKSSRGFLFVFGLGFDWLQVLVLSPDMRHAIFADAKRLVHAQERTPGPFGTTGGALDAGHASSQLATHPATGADDVACIRAQAQSKSLRRTLRLISWVSGDNAVMLMSLGLLTGALATTQKAIMLYGLLMVSLGSVVCARLLRQRVAATHAAHHKEAL